MPISKKIHTHSKKKKGTYYEKSKIIVNGKDEQSSRIPNQYLGLLLLCGIHYRGTTDFSKFPTLSIERPAADFIPYDILNEKNSAVESERELVKQFYVLQQVVI